MPGTMFKYVALLLALMLSATLVAGCPREEADEIPDDQPVVGGEIFVGYEQEPDILNPLIEGGDMMATKDVISNVLWGLLVVTPEFDYEPRLAEEIPTLENGLVTEDPFTVTYNLREEAVWSDGTPITAADVEFTLETIMNEEWHVISREGYDKIDSVESSGDKTVTLVFEEKYASYKDLFSVSGVVLPKHVLEGEDFNSALNEQIPMASGPYLIDTWQHGEYLTLERNDNFWGDQAYLDKVTFKFIPDTNTQLQEFKVGTVDVIAPTPDTDLVRIIQDMDDKEIQINSGTIWEHLAFNTEQDHLDDKRVRQAVAYAIDRQAIVEQIMEGQVKPLQSILVEEQEPFYSPAWSVYEKDINKAQELLEAAGYQKGDDGFYEKDGATLKLTASTTAGNAAREMLQQFMQADLKEVGIDLEIKNTEPPTFFGQWGPEGNFEIGQWAGVGGIDPSITVLLADDLVPPAGQNWYRYQNEEVTELLRESDVTIDQEKRAELLRQAQEIIAEDVPLLPLYQHIRVLAYTDKISGPDNNPTLEGAFWNLGEWWRAAE